MGQATQAGGLSPPQEPGGHRDQPAGSLSAWRTEYLCPLLVGLRAGRQGDGMTVALDFDGVIHRYSKGWRGGVIHDPPMPGAIEDVKARMEAEAALGDALC